MMSIREEPFHDPQLDQSWGQQEQDLNDSRPFDTTLRLL